LIDYEDLIAYLPYSLREEVVYQSSKSLLFSMFKEYKSENLIRKLAVVLESTIYLPGDFIIYKGDIGEEMYFIAEGTVRSLSDDDKTINKSQYKGTFFGETAILFPVKRHNHI
jgi:CRP-like cAMP-binding protein